MAKTSSTRKAIKKPSKIQFDQFFEALAQTSNVAASARVAKLSVDALYRLRRKDAVFATRWHTALCEGYARLESGLLAEALTSASGKVTDATLKARAQKHRLALSLLSAHRSAVRGGASHSIGLQTKSAQPNARQGLLDKLAAMRTQAAIAESGEQQDCGQNSAENGAGASHSPTPTDILTDS